MTDNPQPSDFLDWSDEDLDKLADIKPTDIADAKADARSIPELHALLNAEETQEGRE